MITTAKELRELLKTQVIEVHFTKVDGSNRKMFATLLDAYLPEGGSTKTIKDDDDLITVWDVEVNSWRSFRISFLNYMEYDDDAGGSIRRP